MPTLDIEIEELDTHPVEIRLNASCPRFLVPDAGDLCEDIDAIWRVAQLHDLPRFREDLR